MPPEEDGPAPLEPPELLDPASQLPESCAASGDFFLRSYGEFEFCLTSDRATEEMAFEDTVGDDEDDVDEDIVAREDDDDEPPADSAEEDEEAHPCARDVDDDDDDEDAATRDEGPVLVLVLLGTIGLFRLFTLLVAALLALLLAPEDELEEAGLADDPEPGAAGNAGPLFCWPAGAAPTFGAGMFWHGGSQSADVLDGNGIRFPFLRDRRTYDRDEENEALGIFFPGYYFFFGNTLKN